MYISASELDAELSTKDTIATDVRNATFDERLRAISRRSVVNGKSKIQLRLELIGGRSVAGYAVVVGDDFIVLRGSGGDGPMNQTVRINQVIDFLASTV